jgi:hypothetical protein
MMWVKMRPARSIRPWAVTVIIAFTTAGAVAGAGPLAAAASSGSVLRAADGSPASSTTFTVGGPATASAIPAGFLGLSLEYFAIPAYAGTNPRAIDPVFVQLIRNLAGGQAPELRIGGDTTDWTWWPVRGAPRPAGVHYTLTARWIAVTKALAAKLGAHLILGIDLEADSSTVAAAEANALVKGIGRNRIEALELGNEPELYASFDWGSSGAPGRPPGYDYKDYNEDFTRIVRALPHVPLAGPATGGRRWFKFVGRFLSDHRNVTVATVHRYPLELCYSSSAQPAYPTLGHLLSNASVQGLADSVASVVKAAHARHDRLRVDEINTVSCGSDPAVAQSFGSALWALEVLFDMARVGVDGVNIHTFPGATYGLFSFSHAHGRWQAGVAPEYYGLLLFAQAAPAGSQLLAVSPGLADTGAVKAWATRAGDGTVRVVLVNQGARQQEVAVRVPGTTDAGTLELLDAPGLAATSDVTLAGQGFGASTTTGLLRGHAHMTAVGPAGGEYRLTLPPSSAAMLTL